MWFNGDCFASHSNILLVEIMECASTYIHIRDEAKESKEIHHNSTSRHATARPVLHHSKSVLPDCTFEIRL